MTHLDYSTSLNCSCKCCKSFGPTLFLISNMHFATLNPEMRRTRTLRILQADYLAASLKSALSKIDLLFLCAATSFARLKLLGGTARALNPHNAAFRDRKWKCGARAQAAASDAAFPWKYYLVRRR